MSAVIEISGSAVVPLLRVGITFWVYLPSVSTSTYEGLNILHLTKYCIRKEDFHTEQTESDCLLYIFKSCLILLIIWVKLNLLITMRGRRMKFIKSPHRKHWLTENNKSSLRRSWFALRNCFACVNRPIALAVSSTGNVSWRRAELCFLEFYPHSFLLFCSPQSEMKALDIWKNWSIDTETERRHCCPSQGRSVLTFVVPLGSLAKSQWGAEQFNDFLFASFLPKRTQHFLGRLFSA